MRPAVVAGIITSLASLAHSAEYVWPSEHDEIEEILSLQGGYLSRGFADGVVPCSEGGNVQGRQNAAEWIRSAFHDAIGHDAEAGTGGLDGSLWYELDRAENGGRAFVNTFNFFTFLLSRKATAADLLAMSVIVSHSACGGTTKIPFRWGRVDAAEAGPAGVPEAHTPLETMLSRFTTAGFSQEDMITLVACGHTLGGVHSNNFPDIVPGDSDQYNDTVGAFDSSPYVFDNKIASEYVDGSTDNPLVIGTNDTVNSDRRVFGSDQNKTISELAQSASGFESKCAEAFGKMIDTVPASVQLSDPIEAIDIKPNITKLYINDEGKLGFTGRVRVRTTEGAEKGRDPTDLSVHLTYTNRHGNYSQNIETSLGGTSTGLYNETFAWFEFDTTLDSSQGISKFNIHLTVPSSKETTEYTNQGQGYPVSDTVLYQDDLSCVSRTSSGGLRNFTAQVAVHKDRVSSPLRMDVVRYSRVDGLVVRKTEVESLYFNATGENNGDWAIFEIMVGLSSTAWTTTFDLVLEGDPEIKKEFLKTRVCPRTST